METISVTPNVTTLINVLSVEPANQKRLVALLDESTEASIKKMKGWVSTHLLSSKDSTRVVIYSQWESSSDVEAMQNDPTLRAYFPRILALAKFESWVCESSHCHYARSPLSRR